MSQDRFTWHKGSSKEYSKLTQSGNTITSFFCRDCGTTLWRESTGFLVCAVPNPIFPSFIHPINIESFIPGLGGGGCSFRNEEGKFEQATYIIPANSSAAVPNQGVKIVKVCPIKSSQKQFRTFYFSHSTKKHSLS